VFDVLYRDARQRLTDIAGTLSADQLNGRVAATPAWTVHDLLAHLVGGAADVTAGRVDGIPGERWTARHVSERRARSVGELVDEWERVGPTIEASLVRVGRGPHLGLDIVCHESDLRETLGLCRLDRSQWEPLLGNMVRTVAHQLDQPGTLMVSDECGNQWSFGSGQPTTRLRIDGYELVRATFSRRSQRQIANWDWDPLPADKLTRVGVFGPRDDDQPIPVS
jgi:uncharacterized protein (TIGR03083 family)